MKKILLLGVILITGFVSLGQSPLKVGFCMDDSIAARWRLEHEILKNKISSQGGELLVNISEGDAERQYKQAVDLIDNGVSILIIVPVDAEKAAAIVNYAKTKGVTTIAYSRLVRNCSLDYYLSYDVKDIGTKQAVYAVGKVPQGNYVLLGGPLKDNNSVIIEEAQLEILSKMETKGDIKIVYNTHLEEWTDLEAYFEMTTFLSNYDGTVDVVIAGNDVIAEGAIRSLDLSGINPVVIGLDAELGACKRIAEGTQAMSIHLPGSKLATVAANLVDAIAKKDKDAIKSIVTTKTNNGYINVPTSLLPSVPISIDNLKEAISTYGIHSEQAVFGN